MKRLFRFRYPKITLLIILSVSAYFLFSNSNVQSFVHQAEGLSYLGIFIAGFLFSFGFTTPFAIGFFIIANPQNIYLAALIGGFGAMLADLTIFKIIRFSFMNEFNRLRKGVVIKDINKVLSSRLLSHIKVYLLYAFAGIIIASPLPDEVGVSMLAGLTKVKTRVLVIISFLMNSLGIFIMLVIGAGVN